MLLLINSARPAAEHGIDQLTGPMDPTSVVTLAATKMAQRHTGRPVPNAALLGGFAALSGLVSLESVLAAITERFPAAVARGNVAATREAYAAVERASAPRRDHARPARPDGELITAPVRPPTAGAAVRQIEGSRAVAEAVALSRPEVICAYPISPQTHIVKALSRQVKSGALAPCEFVNVESEFAAMSVAIGASAAGPRAYTATASQGLLYMAEALYNASGLGLPIVMTVANRAIGAPINIWNDHSDAMSQRDCGWIQLYAQTNQEALDLHIQAFRIAQEVSLPVMVCMDGFILTHASERLEIPAQEQVDGFLPPYEPRQLLDPAAPISIGAMVGPEAFTEVRYLAHARQEQALALIPEVATQFAEQFGRDSGGLVRPYRTQDAQTIVMALGSVLGTIQDTIDELRDQGVAIGALGITSFRPFPRGRVPVRRDQAAARAGLTRTGQLCADTTTGARPILRPAWLPGLASANGGTSSNHHRVPRRGPASRNAKFDCPNAALESTIASAGTGTGTVMVPAAAGTSREAAQAAGLSAALAPG